jgi:hypothetical protein
MTPMNRSKAMAMMFLLGALLTGGALGFAGSRVLNGKEPVIRWGDQRSMRDYVGRRLDLSVGQRVAVDSILEDRHRQMGKLMEPLRPKMDSIRMSSRAQMRVLLSPVQQAEFDRMLQELQARNDSTHRH